MVKAQPSNTVHLRRWPWRLSKIQWLTAAALVVALVLVAIKLQSIFSEGLSVQGAASRFAGALRDVAATARQRNAFVTVTVLPATPERRSACVVESGGQTLSQTELPEGVSATGRVVLDPQGVPLEPASFVFRGGQHVLNVAVNERGTVSIPEQNR